MREIGFSAGFPAGDAAKHANAAARTMTARRIEGSSGRAF